MKAHGQIFGDFIENVVDKKTGREKDRINSNGSSLDSPVFVFENTGNSQNREGHSFIHKQIHVNHFNYPNPAPAVYPHKRQTLHMNRSIEISKINTQ